MLSAESLARCIGCGGLFLPEEGAVHRYVESSAGCWAIYGEVLAREYSDPAYFASHRLTVDAYAAQHPGQPSPQSVQSVAIHLISLCLRFEHDCSPGQATQARQQAAKSKAEFCWLEPTSSRGPLSILDVHGARSATEHAHAVRSWAVSVWSAWSPHHPIVRDWVRKVLPPR